MGKGALASIKTKVGPTAAAYNYTMGSRTSSRYRTVVTETRIKRHRSVRYLSDINPAHTIMLPPPRNACSFGADFVFLVKAISLYACYLAPEQILIHQ
ncbi:hypothetical protein TNCV_1066471 [Trichonephila clavipes]|uniref:Uncharacterized protein n=1 Tax=Trichonephila clavipes TaxID=2585209 RepID=A0A8X6UQA5_TRICX|nr:hypothetical protein TNCV_1066471 [Trichonephila clavipes]